MGQIKIKDIEGDAQDVKNILQDLNCDLSTYLGAPAAPKMIPVFWVWIIIPVFFILASCLWIGLFNPAWSKISIMGVFTLCGAILVIVHYNFKNSSVTAIIGFVGLILILLALHVYSPQELARKIEKNTVDTYEHSK